MAPPIPTSSNRCRQVRLRLQRRPSNSLARAGAATTGGGSAGSAVVYAASAANLATHGRRQYVPPSVCDTLALTAWARGRAQDGPPPSVAANQISPRGSCPPVGPIV